MVSVRQAFTPSNQLLPLGECLLFESREFSALEAITLLVRKLNRSLHNHLAQQITNTATSHLSHALAAQAKILPVCVSAGTATASLGHPSRYIEFAHRVRHREGYGYLTVQGFGRRAGKLGVV